MYGGLPFETYLTGTGQLCKTDANLIATGPGGDYVLLACCPLRAIHPAYPGTHARILMPAFLMVGVSRDQVYPAKNTRFSACFSPKIKDSMFLTAIRGGAGVRGGVAVQAGRRGLHPRPGPSDPLYTPHCT